MKLPPTVLVIVGVISILTVYIEDTVFTDALVVVVETVIVPVEAKLDCMEM